MLPNPFGALGSYSYDSLAPGQSPKNCGVTVYEYDSGEERLMLREYNTVYC